MVVGMIDPSMSGQVRIGGCKGILTVWPGDVMKRVCGSSGYDIAVRPSLRKFESPRNDLEVRGLHHKPYASVARILQVVTCPNLQTKKARHDF